MTVSQRILKILDERKITQKEFSEKTGIPQSTISDWRKKNTNPASDKILIICQTLNVTPYELLSSVQEEGNRSRGMPCRVVTEQSEEGQLLRMYDQLSQGNKERLMGYMEAMLQMTEE